MFALKIEQVPELRTKLERTRGYEEVAADQYGINILGMI